MGKISKENELFYFAKFYFYYYTRYFYMKYNAVVSLKKIRSKKALFDQNPTTNGRIERMTECFYLGMSVH